VDWADRLQACYTGAVYDVLRARGHRAVVLPRTIRPLDPSTKVAGPVFTIRGRPDPTLDDHETLLEWTGFLSRAPAGRVIVCQPQDDVRALMGELSAETLQDKGVRGYVVDGGCRDVEAILERKFPVYCRFATPIDVVGAWKPEAYGEPIAIGNTTIRDGDYILGDRDGLIVIPGGIVEAVIEQVEATMQTESLVRNAIRAGVDPQAAYLKWGKF
jgi:regulator of RNase E activity RraA